MRGKYINKQKNTLLCKFQSQFLGHELQTVKIIRGVADHICCCGIFRKVGLPYRNDLGQGTSSLQGIWLSGRNQVGVQPQWPLSRAYFTVTVRVQFTFLYPEALGIPLKGPEIDREAQ